MAFLNGGGLADFLRRAGIYEYGRMTNICFSRRSGWLFVEYELGMASCWRQVWLMGIL
jgi:hypothetical protein